MKALVVPQFGGPEVLTFQDIAVPGVGPGQVLVRLRAAALNRADVNIREGWFAESQPPPITLGVEGAGEIVAVGSGVDGSRVGQRVVLLPMITCEDCAACRSGEDSRCPSLVVIGEHIDGTYAEYICVPARNAIEAPTSLNYEELAASIVAYMTAWHMLVVRGELHEGETILVSGAGSGVGTAAVQVAKALGARVITTTSNIEKAARLREIGADEVINYRESPAFHEAVLELTEGRGVDLAHDSVGGPTVQGSILATRHGGRVIGMGAHAGKNADFALWSLYRKEIDFRGAHTAHSKSLHDFLPLLADGRLRPVIDSTYEFDEALAAQERLLSGERFGKVVMTIR